ncbi:hypothetical protein GF336_04015 [Candidatus Woesearchaeota archaeon]|nr:hypothetical protein [Candidatus Woesearchaeota archaeon]
MKNKILIIFILSIFLSGCTMTGMVVKEVEEVPTQEERDQSEISKALAEKDISVCYSIQSQHVRESCFIKLAQAMGDASICDNLLGKSLKQSCKAGIE